MMKSQHMQRCLRPTSTSLVHAIATVHAFEKHLYGHPIAHHIRSRPFRLLSFRSLSSSLTMSIASGLAGFASGNGSISPGFNRRGSSRGS